MTTLFFFSAKHFRTNFRQRFLSNYKLQMLEILTYYLLRHAICREIFLYQSDANFQLNVDFAYLNIDIRVGVSLLSICSQMSCFMLLLIFIVTHNCFQIFNVFMHFLQLLKWFDGIIPYFIQIIVDQCLNDQPKLKILWMII